MIRMSITRALMASYAMFLQFSKLMKNATDVFAQKKNYQKTFLTLKFVTDTINS